jgi:hypothetical protein
MNRFPYLMLALLLAACPWHLSAAEKFDLTTVEGKVYAGARVTSVEPDGIRIFYADGAAKVPFQLLPPELKVKYGYDAEKASAYTAQKEAEARTAAAIRAQRALEESAQREAQAFQDMRREALESITAMTYKFADLDAQYQQWIEVYTKEGKQDRVKLLEADRLLLRERELQRPALEAAKQNKELQAQNDRLQQQINQLRSAVQQSQQEQSVRRTTYYSHPYYNYQYQRPSVYRYYYNTPLYYVPQQNVPCPTPPQQQWLPWTQPK